MATPHTFTPTDLTHLRRSIELAAKALEAGDAPFGSVLVSGGGEGRVLQEDRNRIHTTGDGTRHPEIDLARWAAAHMTAADRAAATVYTSGEHCPMCAAAHAWVGLGRIVYVAGAAQLRDWLVEFAREKEREREKEEGQGDGDAGDESASAGPVANLPIQSVALQVEVLGPVPELEGDIKALHRRYAGL